MKTITSEAKVRVRKDFPMKPGDRLVVRTGNGKVESTYTINKQFNEKVYGATVVTYINR